MKKQIDHKFMRQALQGILDHIGMDSEGEGNDPQISNSESRSTSNVKSNDGNSLTDTAAFDMGNIKEDPTNKMGEMANNTKKRKDAQMALLATNLASKFNK